MSADFSHGEVQHVIKNIPGVIGFLGATKGGDPVPLRVSEVNRILGKVDELAASRVPIPLRQSEINRLFGKFDGSNNEEEVMLSPFVIGEDVKVMDGPFSGFTGSIAQVFEDRKKVNVTVKIFGRNTPVELNYYQVEKAS